MKHIYADISSLTGNIPKKDTAGFRRMIASALNLENYKCAEECSLIYICKDLQREEFYIFDGNISSEKLPSFMQEKLSFDLLAIGSVYFDVITLQESFPHRNYLYRKLKKYLKELERHEQEYIYNYFSILRQKAMYLRFV